VLEGSPMTSQQSWVCVLVTRKISAGALSPAAQIFNAVLSELQLILIVPTDPIQGSDFCSIHAS